FTGLRILIGVSALLQDLQESMDGADRQLCDPRNLRDTQAPWSCDERFENIERALQYLDGAVRKSAHRTMRFLGGAFPIIGKMPPAGILGFSYNLVNRRFMPRTGDRSGPPDYPARV